MYLSNSFGSNERAKVANGEYRGWLVSPQTRGIPEGIRYGDAWAGDNLCYKDNFSVGGFVTWLESMLPYQETCLFIVAPDELGNWATTLQRWQGWQPFIRLLGFPVAFVGQDYQPLDEMPWATMDTYFVGGTDEWKDSAESLELVRQARARNIPVHLGRGNTRPRLSAFWKAYRLPEDPPGYLPGFTFDGNGLRYPGKNEELAPAFAELWTEILL